MSRNSNPTLRLATPDQLGLAQAPKDDRIIKARIASRSLQSIQNLARELYEFRLYRESTGLYRYLTTIDPSNPTHWYWFGRSLLSAGDPLAAAEVFELGGRLSHAVHFARLAADAWLRAGYPERAEAAQNLKGATAPM